MRKTKPALPIRDGLNPTRVQLPLDWEPTPAGDFVWHLVSSQRHRGKDDDREAVSRRFHASEVVLDDGTPLREAEVLKPGTFINFYRTPAPEREVPGDLEVVYEDRDLLVVNKPPFLATLPRGQHIRQTALVKARVQFGIPELSPAHRLDRLTSGILMFTKRPEIRGAYQTLFDKRLPRKTYRAYTAPLADIAADEQVNPIPAHTRWREWDTPTEDKPWVLTHRMVKVQGRLSTYLQEPVTRNQHYPYDNAPHDTTHDSTNSDNGYPPNAVTRVMDIRDSQWNSQPATMWTLQPATGRTHQLRLVMRSVGMPILHDPLYTTLTDTALTNPNAPTPRPTHTEHEDFTTPMGLIAHTLAFCDPYTGHTRIFSLPNHCSTRPHHT